MRGKKKAEEHHRKKNTAHKIYNQALRNKKLIPAEKCENCLETSNNMHGHHVDYDKPLDVIWLCATCHIKAHCESKFIDGYSSAGSFKDRTSKELSQDEKDNLYRKLSLNQFRRIPIEERCTPEELNKLNEYQKIADQYMYQYFEARAKAEYYYQKISAFRQHLHEKYPQDFQQIY